MIPKVYCPKCSIELTHKTTDVRGEAIEFAEQAHIYQCPECGALCRVNLVWLVPAGPGVWEVPDALAGDKEE